MNDISIVVDHVSKSFELPEERIDSLKHLFVRLGRRGKKERQHVLDDVNLRINEGEFVGIVGRNGSGKSTLLKLLAGVYYPTAGDVRVAGSLTPFIELGVGFNPQLSGHDNVYLNGALLGFTHAQVDDMYNDIVDFAELHGAMDKKLRNYSSGMQVRLAFSIAIRTNSDILLLDEVLAVGDYAFQQKCFAYFKKLKQKGRTVVLVSHDRSAVEEYCDRAILLEGGRVVADGLPKDIYRRYFKRAAVDDAEIPSRELKRDHAVISSVRVVGATKKDAIDSNHETITLQMRVKALKSLKAPVFGIIIEKVGAAGIITQLNTRVSRTAPVDIPRGKEAIVDFDLKNVFGNGEYLVSGQVAEQKVGGEYYDWREKIATFLVTDRDFDYVPLYISEKTTVSVRDEKNEDN
jgi:ABC-2 type transport system ATP-binding protein